jgi:Fe-S cluster assembly protein SufD
MISGEKHSHLNIGEYHGVLRGAGILTNSSLGCRLSSHARIFHQMIQFDAPCQDLFNFKSTFVTQQSLTQYKMNEIRLGAGKTRHDLLVNQLGSSTKTDLKHFLAAGDSQCHELHSKTRLDYPDGRVNQLHKCIVSDELSSGVFDGNVKVNLPAKDTHAHQMSKNLLLAPKGVITARPNLQIAADEVKCSHGCSVSDINYNEVFYFASRGIDEITSRQVIGLSFGSEIYSEVTHKYMKQLINETIVAQLTRLSQS